MSEASICSKLVTANIDFDTPLTKYLSKPPFFQPFECLRVLLGVIIIKWRKIACPKMFLLENKLLS